MTIQLHIPYPPSANDLWTRTRHGMRKTDKYAAWLEEAGWTIKQQRPGKIEGPYKISIHAQRPDKRQRDLDNLIKPISDVLQSVGVIHNDCECEMITARWLTMGSPGIQVLIDRTATEEESTAHAYLAEQVRRAAAG